MNDMWDAVDAYLETTLGLNDPVLAAEYHLIDHVMCNN